MRHYDHAEIGRSILGPIERIMERGGRMKVYTECVICKNAIPSDIDKICELCFEKVIKENNDLRDVIRMKINRTWAMPNKWTFTINPIKQLLKEEITSGIWIDPFSGKHSPATIKNDLDLMNKADYHLDALEFLKNQKQDYADGLLYDPPYSMRQASECYRNCGKEKLTGTVTSMKYWADCKKQIARIIKPEGKIICCGWNSNGIGEGRGFKMTRILIVPHGGSKNDTIVTVERKVQSEFNLRGSQ